MGFEVGQTGVILPVPEAEPLVSVWRRRYDRSAPLGVPAHITVLYPFLPVEQVDDGVLAELGGLCRRVGHLELTFRRTGWFAESEVLWLAPEPAGPVVALTEAVTARWPEVQPYGGAFDEVTPHLTVAEAAPDGEVTRMRADLDARLPLTARVGAAWLVAFDGVRWAPVRALSLSG
ncbi:2'-5' RNA ligase family protein [Oryzihumus sp.]|jgi:hypothetical protein|uniref:2'-5' RNA ligase family protein n=1 Tax=Oryzihumus sp. TaxID=1968903 RepID=UPI002EDB576C